MSSQTQVFTFDIGDKPTVTATFRDRSTGALANPSGVTVKMLEPDGTLTTYVHPDVNITNPSVGIWEFTLPMIIDQDGGWTVKFYGTAGIIAAESVLLAIEYSAVD